MIMTVITPGSQMGSPATVSKKSFSKMGSQKTLNSRQIRIFTTENNYSDYMQEQFINNRLNWTDDTNKKSSKIDDICDSTESRVAHW